MKSKPKYLLVRIPASGQRELVGIRRREAVAAGYMIDPLYDVYEIGKQLSAAGKPTNEEAKQE